MKQKFILLISFLFLAVANVNADWVAGNSSVSPSSPIPACTNLTASGTFLWNEFIPFINDNYLITLTYALPPSVVAATGTPSLTVNSVPFLTANFTLVSGSWTCDFPPGTVFPPGAQLEFKITGLDVVNSPSFVNQQLTHFISSVASIPNDNVNNNLSTVVFSTTATPTVTISASATTITVGNSVTLSGGGALSYTWDSAIVQNGVPFFPPVGTHVYTVTGTDANACTGTSSVTITVNPTNGDWVAGDPSIAPSSPIPACGTLTASGSFTWLSFDPFPNNNHQVILTFTLPSSVIVSSGTPSLTYLNNAPVPNTVFAQTATGYTCTFLPGTVFPPGEKFNFRISNLQIVDTPAFTNQPATHSISYGIAPPVGDATTNNSSTSLFSTSAVPTITASASATTLCAGDSVTLTATSSVPTFSWNNSVANGVKFVPPIGSTIYTVTATAANNCTATATVTITVNSAVQFDSLKASPSTICSGANSTLKSFPKLVVPGIYCASNATNPADTRVDSVIFAGVATGTSITSTIGQTYTNYTGVVIPVVAGSSYPLAIRNGSSGITHYPAFVKVFIDYNQSGSFEASEMVYSFGNTTAFNTIPATTVAIPLTAFNGTTRMRVVLREGGTTTTTVACGTYTYGETEDYTISITGGATKPPGYASIVWTPAANLNTASGDSVIAQNLTATTLFTAIGTDLNGCKDTATVSVNVTPLPVIVASATPAAICPGGSSVLTVSGAQTYVWNPGALTGSSITVSPTATTNYVVTGTDNVTSCSASKTVTVVVNKPLVKDSLNASPTSVCGGDTSKLAANFKQVRTFDAYSFASATGATLDPMTTSATAVGPNEDDTYTSGHSIGFNFVYNGTTYTTFGTSSNGFIVLGGAGGNSDLGNGFGSSMDAGNTPMIAPWWDDCHTRNDSITYRTIGTAPNRTLIVNFGLAIRYLSATANTKSQVWLREGTNQIELVYGPSTALNSPSGSVGLSSAVGTSQMQSVNTANNTSSNSIAEDLLTVFPTPGTKYTFTPPAATTISYAWTPAAKVVSPALAMTSTTPLTDTTKFYVSATSSLTGCVSNDSVTVNVKPTPTLAVSASPSATVCTGETVTLMSGATGYNTLTWNGNTTTGPDTVLTPALAGKYTVLATNTTTGCFKKDSIQVTVNTLIPMDSVKASPMSVCSGDTATLQAYPGITSAPCLPTWTSPGATGDYIDTLKLNGINYSTNGDNASDYANLGSVGSYAAGVPISVATQTGPAWAGGIGIWVDFNQSGTFDPSEFVYSSVNSTAQQTGSFTIPTTAYNGITTMRVIERYNTVLGAGDFCVAGSFGETEEYTITITGASAPVPAAPGFASITWSPATNLNTTNGASVLAQGLTSTTTYTVTGTAPNGCVSKDSVTVTVIPLPTVVGTATPDTICVGGTVALNATGTATAYSWNPGSLSGPTQSVSPSVSTDYILSGVSGTTGCVGKDTVPVYVHPMVSLTAVVDANESCPGNADGIAHAVSPGAEVTIFSEGFSTAPSSSSFLPDPSAPGWTVSNTTGLRWKVDNNGGNSSNTGPISGANTPGYVFLETSSSGTPDTLTSPSINLTTVTAPINVRFYTHMYGATMNKMELLVDNGTTLIQLWSDSGQIQTASSDPYTMRLVNLDAYAGQTITLRYVGHRGSSFTGDMAIDDIKVFKQLSNTLLWSNSAVTDTIKNLSAGTYTVVALDNNGCSASDTVVVTAPVPSGDLTQSTVGNGASTPGTGCDTFNHPNDGSMYNYYDAACRIIASVQEPAGGTALGIVNTCANIAGTVPMHNGQPFVPRWFQISPTNQGAAVVTLYVTQDDFDDYNVSATTNGWPLLPANPTDATGIANLRITKNDNGGLGVNPVVISPSGVIWNSTNMRWEVTFSTPNFSQFRLHAVNPTNAALAVEYKTFTVSKQATSDLVEWTTVSESNSSHFNVQRSADGATFETLGVITSQAVGNVSTKELRYSFIDETPQIGHNYYRLEQVDMENRTSYTKIIDIIWGAAGSAVSIYPNPTKDILNIDLSTDKVSQTEIKLLDMSGRVVKAVIAQTVNGMNNITIDLSEVASGIYGIQIFENNKLTHVSKVRKND